MTPSLNALAPARRPSVAIYEQASVKSQREELGIVPTIYPASYSCTAGGIDVVPSKSCIDDFDALATPHSPPHPFPL